MQTEQCGGFTRVQRVSRWSWFRDLFWLTAVGPQLGKSAVNPCANVYSTHVTITFRGACMHLRKVHCLPLSRAVLGVTGVPPGNATALIFAAQLGPDRPARDITQRPVS